MTPDYRQILWTYLNVVIDILELFACMDRFVLYSWWLWCRNK